MESNHATYPPRWATGTAPDQNRAADWALQTVRNAVHDRRLSETVDMFETCELLSLDRDTAARTYAIALALSISQALGKQPVVHAAGHADLTFDELWFLRLLERSRVRDAESVAFLISSRVAYPFRNSLVFLIEGLTARLYGDTIAAAGEETESTEDRSGFDPYA
ncbi:MAG: hypothetical protein AAGF71_12680 [Pseudomonadota bacterium]